MKFNTFLVVWHNKEPVYSIDFHPTSNRFATAGADKTVKIWRWTADGEITVEFVATLQRHNAAVNIVRFSPNGEFLASGADDGMVFFWKLNPNAPPAASTGVSEDDETLLNKESGKEIYSLDWSPDSCGLVIGSIDTTVSVINVAAAPGGPRKVQEMRDHTHYVQGVGWDPHGRFLLSQSIDRTIRIYKRPKKSKKGVPTTTGNYSCCYIIKKRTGEGFALKPKKKPDPTKPIVIDGDSPTDQPNQNTQPTVPTSEPTPTGAPEVPAVDKSTDNSAVPTQDEPFVHRMFLDEGVSSFFRRLCWSPCGSFFFAPTGTFMKNATSEPVDCTYIFARDNMKRPIAYIPCPSKASIIVRCNPVLFKLRDIGTAEKLLDLKYRIVFAVATIDSVLVYDTQHVTPILVLKDIHYASLSDLAWSPDGYRLGISSTDGFCSLLKFETVELGQPLDQAEYDIAMQKVIEAKTKPTASQSADGAANDDANNGSFTDDAPEEARDAKRKEGPEIEAELTSPAKVVKVDDAFAQAVQAAAAPVASPFAAPSLFSAIPAAPSSSNSKRRITPMVLDASNPPAPVAPVVAEPKPGEPTPAPASTDSMQID